MSAWRRIVFDWLLPAALGGVATLGFAPYNLYPLTLLAVLGLVALWRGHGPVRCAWRGFVFASVHFATGVYWIYVAMHGHAGVPAALAVLSVGGLSVYLAFYPALAGALAGLMRRLPLTLWALLAVPAAWTIGEWLRGWVFTGFDWLALGYIGTELPVNGLAPIIGVHGLSFLVMAAAGTLYMLYVGRVPARLVALVLILATPVLLWCLPPAVHWTHPAGPAMKATVVQGNTQQSEKWDPATLAPTMAAYERMTETSDADLVVWPEVAIPALAQRVATPLRRISRQAAANDQLVLAGLLRLDPDGQRYYNSLIALGDGRGEYHKRHLVPFGEYVPGPKWLGALLDGMGAPIGGLAIGERVQPLFYKGDIALGASICFEDVFSRNILTEMPRANILVNVTNDAWFAGSNGPPQHLQIARMRAAEMGRPMVRAANTGISANIDFTGRVFARTDEDVRTRLTGMVVPREGVTPFVRYGETPVVAGSGTIVLLGLLSAAAGALRRRGQNRVADRRRALAGRV